MKAVKSRGRNHGILIHSPKNQAHYAANHVKFYQDQLARLDKYGRFIDDSQDYIISQALAGIQAVQRIYPLDRAGEKMLAAMWNARSPVLNLLVPHRSLDHSGIREKSVLAKKSCARCKQKHHRPVEDRVGRRAVESRNLVSFVVSTAVGLYLFRNRSFPAENDPLQMVLLQKP